MAAHDPDGIDHLFGPGKGLNGMPGQVASVVGVAAVEVRLAAAGLRGREIDFHAEAAQQPHRRRPHVGEQGVAQASHQ